MGTGGNSVSCLLLSGHSSFRKGGMVVVTTTESWCSGSPKERHPGCQDEHACFQLPSVCPSVLQVKLALGWKGNIPRCCKCNSCGDKILSEESQLTETSDRATCSLMPQAWLRQTIWRQTRLKCTLSTVYMFVKWISSYLQKQWHNSLPLPFSWVGLYLWNKWCNPVHVFHCLAANETPKIDSLNLTNIWV